LHAQSGDRLAGKIFAFPAMIQFLFLAAGFHAAPAAPVRLFHGQAARAVYLFFALAVPARNAASGFKHGLFSFCSLNDKKYKEVPSNFLLNYSINGFFLQSH
jgi:hypothetical protein